MRVLVDTCVIVDYLLNRKDFSKEAEKVIMPVVKKTIYGFITVKSLMDIHYVVKKYLHNENDTRDVIGILLDSFVLVDSTAQDAIKALSSEIKDYEDALMTETAENIGVDYVVTRNIKDFKKTNVQIITPTKLASIIS